MLCGYAASLEGLWSATERALWVLRNEPDVEILQDRFGQFGFRARQPVAPWIPRRRKLPRAEVEEFLIRNCLGPASWKESLPDPGSETEPENEAPDFEKRRLQRIREEEEESRALQTFLLHGASKSLSSDRRVLKRSGPFGAAAHPLMPAPHSLGFPITVSGLAGLGWTVVIPQSDYNLTPFWLKCDPKLAGSSF